MARTVMTSSLILGEQKHYNPGGLHWQRAEEILLDQRIFEYLEAMAALCCIPATLS
jgi:hypothetical protein